MPAVNVLTLISLLKLEKTQLDRDHVPGNEPEHFQNRIYSPCEATEHARKKYIVKSN